MTALWVRATIRLRLPSPESGQDMVEYALLCGLISIVAIALMFAVGPYLRLTFQNVINAINSG